MEFQLLNEPTTEDTETQSGGETGFTKRHCTFLSGMSYNKGATQYAIRYPFKQGFTYQIKLYGKSTLGSTANSLLPSAAIFWSNDSAGVNSSFSCTGPVSISSTFDNSYGHVAFTTGWSWSPNLLDGVAPQNFTYLLVAAVPANGTYTNDQTVSLTHIRKIEIVEIPPAGAFSVSPAAPSMTCGSTTPITFTVNNNNNITGVTNYTWNLGATSNGWLLPNGSAAPATYSTGTTNTLTLTPNCGNALSAVSATVTANGINYNTNASTISISQPTFSIGGNSSLCSGNTPYIINGLPCNATIAWTAPPSNLGSLSSLTTSPTTLTFGGTSGNITLTANVTSCGATTPANPLSVHVGAYTNSDYTLSGNGGSIYWCPNQSIGFNVSGGGSSNYTWTIPTGWTTVYNSGNIIAIKAPSSPYPQTGTLSVSFTEPCGTTITLNRFLAFSSSACTSSPYTVSPNPASSYITIACASLQTYCNIAAVQITDLSGNVLSSASWPYTNQTVQMPVYSLQNGTYIARTYSGTQWYTNTFTVQH